MSYYENLRFVADYYGLDSQIKKLVDNFRRAEDVVVLDEESMEQARAELDAAFEKLRTASRRRAGIFKYRKEKKTMDMKSEFGREGAHYDRLARAAEHFGVEAQVCKTIEEVGEFLAELGRTMNGEANRRKLTEEIADVYNMLDQLCYLFGIEDDVQGAAERKMERTIQRMEAGETDEAVQDIHG